MPVNFNVQEYLRNEANNRRADLAEARASELHAYRQRDLGRVDRAAERSEDSQSLNAAISGYRNQIDKLKNDYKSISGATLTDQQAIGELMGDTKFQRVAEQYINSSPRIRDQLMQGRNNRAKYSDVIGMRYIPGEGGQPHSVENIDQGLNTAGDTNQYGYYTPGKRDGGSWVPTLQATEEGFLDNLTEYFPFTENKSSDPDDPVIQLSNEDIFNFIDGEQALNAGVDLNAATRRTNALNRSLGDDIPLHTEAEQQQKMQRFRAPGAEDAYTRLGDLYTTSATSDRGLQLARNELATQAEVASNKAEKIAEVARKKAEATARAASQTAAAKAAYNLNKERIKATKDLEKERIKSKNTLDLASGKQKYETSVANRKVAIDNIESEVDQGNLAAVLAAIPQLTDTDSPAMRKQMDTWKKRALLKSLRKSKFGHTEAWEIWDKAGIWNSFFNGSSGYTAGDLDVTSILRDRLKIETGKFGTYLIPLNSRGEEAGDPMNMDEFGDAERTMLTDYLNPNRKEVVGSDGALRLLTEAQTIEFEKKKHKILKGQR